MNPISFRIKNADANVHEVAIFNNFLAKLLGSEFNSDLEIFLFEEFLVNKACEFVFFMIGTNATKVREKFVEKLEFSMINLNFAFYALSLGLFLGILNFLGHFLELRIDFEFRLFNFLKY